MIGYIVKKPYPLSDFDEESWERAASFIGDLGLKSYTGALSRSYDNNTYNYEWEGKPLLVSAEFIWVMRSAKWLPVV